MTFKKKEFLMALTLNVWPVLSIKLKECGTIVAVR